MAAHTPRWTYKTENGIGSLTLCHPPVNALSTSDWMALPGALREIEQEPISVLLVTGEGKHFCAGNDKGEFARDLRTADTVTDAVAVGLKALAEIAVPTIAAVSGAAVGSGFMIASLCDTRVCTQDAVFGLPEIRVGAYGGYSIARRVLPTGVARNMVLSGQYLDAQRAYQLGYVHQVCGTKDAMLDAAAALARTWAESDRYVLREAKRTFGAVEHSDLWAGYALERGLAVRHMTLNA